MRRLDQRQVEQRHQAAARFHLGPREIRITGTALITVEGVHLQVHLPDHGLLGGTRKIKKETRIEALGPSEFWRELRDVVGGANHKHVALMVIEPREKPCEHPRGDTRVGLAARRDTGERFFHLIDHGHASCHRVDQQLVRLARDDGPDGLLAHDQHGDFVEGSPRALFDLLRQGIKLGPEGEIKPYGQGLFIPGSTSTIDGLAWGNATVAEVLEALTVVPAPRGQVGKVKLSYRELNVEQLGSIYEGLLELAPAYARVRL